MQHFGGRIIVIQIAMNMWTKWAPFPDPRKKEFLVAPLGPGVYELRLKGTGKLVLLGIGKSCALRMSSLLPAPLGQGMRRNFKKRAFVLKNLSRVEYRTCACATITEARLLEKQRMVEAEFLFPT